MCPLTLTCAMLSCRMAREHTVHTGLAARMQHYAAHAARTVIVALHASDFVAFHLCVMLNCFKQVDTPRSGAMHTIQLVERESAIRTQRATRNAQQHAAHKSTHTYVLKNIIPNTTTCVNCVVRARNRANDASPGAESDQLTSRRRIRSTQAPNTAHKHGRHVLRKDRQSKTLIHTRVWAEHSPFVGCAGCARNDETNVFAHKHVTKHTCPCWH